MSLVETDPYSAFLFGIRSPKTKEKIVPRLKTFFDFVGIEPEEMSIRCKAFVKKGKTDQIWVFNKLIQYLQFQKDRVEKKEISAGTLKNYFLAVKVFCEMNQIDLSWRRISRGLPKVKRYADDRAPTIEEIRSLCDYPDRRIKPIIFVMASSGIRLGAWDYLKWKHVIPKYTDDDKLLGAKLIVYSGESEEYFTFITSEAYLELKKWMDYREQCGENINLDSWLMRNRWDKKKGYSRGLISIPRKLKATGIKRIIEDALWTQQIRRKLESGKKRHEFQTDHGFRKWFKTRSELAGMKPINIEILIGHSVGVSDSYYRPTENEIFQDYLRANSLLTIGEESSLKQKVNNLQERHDQINFIKYQHELEIRSIREEMNKRFADLVSIIQDHPKLAFIKPSSLVEASLAQPKR